MSESAAGVMDLTSIPRLNLMLLVVFLLVSPNIVCLHGHSLTVVDHHLHCVNDYLTNISCSLTIAPSEKTSDSNSSYWLKISYTEFRTQDFVCMLTNTNGDYFCTVKVRDDDDCFTDMDVFEISLCHNQSNGSQSCEQLDETYEPFQNIKPNPPCCLTVSQNSSQHHFTWNSTYEKYDQTSLVDNLDYQLHFYKRQDKDDVAFHQINTDRKSYSMDDHIFVPNTDYGARVRSSPNKAHFKGEWSEWSSEVHWTTKAPLSDFSTFAIVSGLSMKVFIPIFVIVPLILLLCYARIKKWRQNAFIPTPAPYFHTLYSDCQGDFKSWVVTQENTADMLKTEETLHIYTLTKCADVQEEDCPPHFHQQLMEGSAYNNITNPGCDPSLLGVPYAVSTIAPLSSSGSLLKNLTFSFQPESPAEGDSGCWLCSDTSLEKDPPWYCNEYCTLSAFQQPGPVTAECHGSPSTRSCSAEIIRVDAFGQA
ncbi:interleukin-21 receptor [Thunnus maccoyii]|uniref:interleukin-21 receptor n=1 Tax=Thunnus maccoyii TaxID=8240 RepID=UPI001C4C3FE2|nr:interleukin-21 receptor [Thunnus maccoyii]